MSCSALICSDTARRMAAALSLASSGRSKAPRFNSLRVMSSSLRISWAERRISSVAPAKRVTASSTASRMASRRWLAAPSDLRPASPSSLSTSDSEAVRPPRRRSARSLDRFSASDRVFSIERVASSPADISAPRMLPAVESACFSVSDRILPISAKEVWMLWRRFPATWPERCSARSKAPSTMAPRFCIVVSISSERLTRPTARSRSACWRSSSVPTRLDWAADRSSEAWLSILEWSPKRPTIEVTCDRVSPETADRRSSLPSSRRPEVCSRSAALDVVSTKRSVVWLSCPSAAAILVATCSIIAARPELLSLSRSMRRPALSVRLSSAAPMVSAALSARVLIAATMASFSARRRSALSDAASVIRSAAARPVSA